VAALSGYSIVPTKQCEIPANLIFIARPTTFSNLEARSEHKIRSRKGGFRMDSQQMTFVHGSRQTLLRRAACPAADETTVARFVETICAEGDWLHLRSNAKYPWAASARW